MSVSLYGGVRPTKRLASAVFVMRPPFVPGFQCRAARVKAGEAMSVASWALTEKRRDALHWQERRGGRSTAQAGAATDGYPAGRQQCPGELQAA